MKLRDRIVEIKRRKGVCDQVENAVEEHIIKPYEILDKETLANGVKVEVFAEFRYLHIVVGNTETLYERLDDPTAAIAEMKAYQKYFESEDYETQKIEEPGVTGFAVIL